MAEWIDQFEYRWQPAKDFTLIAGSGPSQALTRWSDQIALWVRHPPVSAPVQSVRYEIFDEDTVVLAWRQRNVPADGFQDETEGRPEASRVLIGPLRLLRPEVAVTLCRTGLPEAIINPRPGLVAVDTQLPRVDASALASLTRSQADALDRLASNEKTGLYKVIATALTDVDTALSVQLPDRFILGPLREGKQGCLLWGLVRTLLPLIGYGPGLRGWSFSTFEQPLGDMDPRGLPDIVFRAPGSSQRPSNTRPEIVVRPFDASGLSDKILYQEFAVLLVAAYRQLGGYQLGQYLAATGDIPSLEQRIRQAEETIYEVLPAEALAMARQQRMPGTDSPVTVPAMTMPPAPDATATGEPGWAQDATTSGRFPGNASPAPSRPVVPAAPPTRPDDTPPAYHSPVAPPPPRSEPPSWQKALETSQVAPSRANEAAPPLPTGVNRPPWTGTPTHTTLISVFDYLDGGPANPSFESAWESLWTGTFPDLTADRHAARKRLPERGWYIAALMQHDEDHFEDTLEKIFEHAVVPDLGYLEVTEEVARWVSHPDTPPSVFRSLNAAAQDWPGWPELMDQILVPAVGRRWLAEHDVYTASADATVVQGQRPPGPQAATRNSSASHAAGGRRHGRGLPDRRLFSDPVTLLSLFCAVLFTLLVLALAH